MDSFVTRVHERPVGGRYTIIQKVSSGGFGAVYIAKELRSDHLVAVKLESISVDPSYLENEFERYETFATAVGFPHVYWFGQHDYFRAMAFELLGPSLEDLFVYCGHRLSLKTTLMIADQILYRLEGLHAAGIVHRDIKPRNFLLGSGANGNVVYVTDFGLAEEYTTPSDGFEEGAALPPFLVGTTKFASISGHQGLALSPKHDLESLGYMLVYFLRGKLPWDSITARSDSAAEDRAVMDIKMATSAEKLCEKLPKEFAEYMITAKALPEGQRPDYGKIRDNFRALAKREDGDYDNVSDWTIRAFLETERPGSWTSGLL